MTDQNDADSMEPVASPPPSTAARDLEIKDARLIFDSVWSGLVSDFGREGLRFPKEIILLGGAPGAGKGTNTEFIRKARGFTCSPIVVSDLLDSPEAKALKDNGHMVGDREVIGIILRHMLKEEFGDGAILDGFPRTKVQVECMKMLVDRIEGLHRDFAETPLARHFRRPIIHVMVLFVEEKTSIERQLSRGQKTFEGNERARVTGMGEIREVRATDLDPERARRRYRVFKELTWDALQSLKEVFFYHFINAEGSFDEVEQNILTELRYQSSLELDPKTFDRLRRIPLASEMVVHARQELVRRLDRYALEQTELFGQVVDVVEVTFMPIIERHAISGSALVNTEDELFSNPEALVMLIDIFSERGFHAVVDKHRESVPQRVDLQTGEITLARRDVHRIRIDFEGSEIRRG